MEGRATGLRLLVLMIALGLVAALALAAAACGSDDGASTTSASAAGAAATTSTGLPASSPTSGSSSTTLADPSTTTAGATSGPTGTTEKLSSAERRMPNGHVEALGYIDAVWSSGGTRYISIDYVEMLTGEPARQAAIEAGEIDQGDDLPNDYYIRNVNPMLREFVVAGDASFITVTMGGGTEEEQVSWDQFKSFWTEFAPEGAQHLAQVPWWIERDGDVVVSIKEQYLP